MNSDTYYMQEALKEAEKAFSLGEVPVGAVLVYREEIIARAHNQIETFQDASAHAELICLRKGSLYLKNWRLSETTLYCTLEPCCMCAGAMILSRIDRLVWGAKDLRHGAHGSWVNLLDTPHPIHRFETCPHVLEKEAAALMVSFFQKRRRENECKTV